MLPPVCLRGQPRLCEWLPECPAGSGCVWVGAAEAPPKPLPQGHEGTTQHRSSDPTHRVTLVSINYELQTPFCKMEGERRGYMAWLRVWESSVSGWRIPDSFEPIGKIQVVETEAVCRVSIMVPLHPSLDKPICVCPKQRKGTQLYLSSNSMRISSLLCFPFQYRCATNLLSSSLQSPEVEWNHRWEIGKFAIIWITFCVNGLSVPR